MQTRARLRVRQPLLGALCMLHRRSCTEQLHSTHHTVLDETNAPTCLRLAVELRSRSSATRSSTPGHSHHQQREHQL